ncbi:MAG: NADH-quinone oxidoreductase subunit NuoE [Kiritimatiellae bacterium]|nr:NADH-quinone oxidoreductase subunit NuoE [Kiritimatiellia bacterium]
MQGGGPDANIGAVLSSYARERDELIPMLQAVQASFGYISEQAVSEIACRLDISENDVYGVATFYTQFRFTRPGDHIVKVCQGTACHVRGGKRIMNEVCKLLGIRPGETTPDYKFSLERVACFGSCALSPVVVVDGKVYGRMTVEKVRQLLRAIE